MSTQRHVLLGVFFLAIVGVLGYYTLFLTDFRLFSEQVRLKVYFSETNGLRRGDTVLVAGMRWGKVESLTFEPTAELDDRIEVDISLYDPITLREDFQIRIEDATLLGGKNLTIEPGIATSAPIPEDTRLYGSVQGNVLQALGEVVDENREALSNTISNLEAIAGDVREGKGIVGRLVYDEELANRVSDAITNISNTFENTDALTQRLREGEGTLGKLFAEDGLANSFQSLIDDAGAVVTDVRQGKGTIGKLVYDEELSQDVTDTVRNVRDVSQKINEGKGSLGRLVNDEAIADNIERITQGLADGEGTLGKLLREDEVYDNVRRISEDLSVTTTAIRNGEGTIGKLVFDDEVYRELEKAVRTFSGSLEEAREAAPISTFLNTIFIGF